MGAWDDIGRLVARFGSGETEEERRRREEQEAMELYAQGNILSEPILVRAEIERYERDHGILPKESFAERLQRYGNPDRANIEDRRGEVVREDSAGLPIPAGVPEGRPWGSESVLDPQWVDPVTRKIRPDLPPSVLQDLAESEQWSRLRDEREDLIDGEYEPTDSPLILRKRNENGTVTYVHALTGNPLFDEGLYGMNDPQGAEPGVRDAFDPYWREGRREW